MQAHSSAAICPARPQVWLSPLNVPAACLPEAWLDAHEKARLARFSHPMAARRFLLARTILKQTVAALEDTAPEDVLLEYTPNGKPFLPGAGRPYLSITHSAEAVAVVLADHAVGIDLESAQRSSRPWERPATFLHPREADKLAEVCDCEQRALLFTRRWSCQEAAIKLLDSSIFHINARVEFEHDLNAGICCERRVFFASWLVRNPHQLVRLDTQGSESAGLVMSLAANEPLAEVDCHVWQASLAVT